MFLCADVGGTSTRMRLEDEQGVALKEKTFPSQQYPKLEQIIAEFLVDCETPIAACFAVAGPVLHQDDNASSKITNLPWIISRRDLVQKTKIKKIELLNDFEAVAHGIEILRNDDLLELQKGEHHPGDIKAIIGAGTGLGQAFISYQNCEKQIHPTEGGHVDFAATNQQQWQLKEYISKLVDHVSYERLLSGTGLAHIFQFICLMENSQERLDQVFSSDDPAAEISRLAQRGHHSEAVSAMDLFMQIYGAQAGNLALNTLCFGGLYIAGGIAAKNLFAFETATFMNSFLAKGKMRDLMPRFPVFVIKNPQTGLLGAGVVARKIGMM